MLLVDSVAEAHHLHLKALVRQERGIDYQRQDYLSPDWQRDLLRPREGGEEAVKIERSPSAQTNDEDKKTQQRESPTSTAPSSSLFDFDLSVASSLELCMQWRTKIVEWKYKVVDRFGT